MYGLFLRSNRHDNHFKIDFGVSFMFLEFFSPVSSAVGHLMVKIDLKMAHGLWMESKPLNLL